MRQNGQRAIDLSTHHPAGSQVPAPSTAPIAAGSSLPPGSIGVTLVLFAVGLLSPNIILTSLSACVLLVGWVMLWRPGESPILLFVFLFQWIQATTKLLHANWRNVSIEELAEFRPNEIETAVALSLIALFFLALGMRTGAGRWKYQDAMRLKETAFSYRLDGFFKLYVIASIIAIVAQYASGFFPPLSQPILAFANLKWAFYWMLAYATFVRGNEFRYWLIALGIELTMSVGTYFSDFKTPLFFTLIAAGAARLRLSGQQLFALCIIAALTISLGVVWTAIKEPYRNFVSGGGGQVVRVDFSSRIDKMAELVADIDQEAIEDATEALANRLSYVDFFGVVLINVPSAVPHEWGALWWDAISRPFMPRVLFPNKAKIHDSDRTNYYTGLGVYGADRGTSISIGYMGESYIDFGYIGMMFVIFALGLVSGAIYRWLNYMNPSRILLGASLATATIFEMTFLEMSNAKMAGAIIVSLLASVIVMRIIAPRYLPQLRSHI